MTTTITKTVGPGKDYSTLAAWQAGEVRNLVTADQIARALCYNMSDTTSVDLDGWTVDATRYIVVEAAEAHGGVFSTNAYRRTMAVDFALLTRMNYTRFLGIQMKVTNAAMNTGFYAFGTSGVVFERCISLCTHGGTFLPFRIQNGSGTLKMSNNLSYDAQGANSAGIKLDSFAGTAYLYNNTQVNCLQGIFDSSGLPTIISKNNLYHSQGLVGADGYVGAFDASSTNNASNLAADAPGSNARNSQTYTFVDEAGDDFHLAAGDAGAKDHGADLSADASYAISVDIDNVARSGTWDIGADEYVSATTPPTAGFSTAIDRKVVTVTDSSVAGTNPITTREYVYDTVGAPSTRTTSLSHTYSVGGTYTITQYVNDGVTAEQSTTHSVTTKTRYRYRLRTYPGTRRSNTDDGDRPDA